MSDVAVATKAETGQAKRNGLFNLTAYHWIVLALLTLVGLWLRIQGLDFGLPHDSRPDEIPNIQVSFRLLADLVGGGNGALNPRTFNYGSLYYYLLTFSYWVYFSVGQLNNQWVDFQQYLMAYQQNPIPFHLVMRSVSAFASALCIPAIYFAARAWQFDCKNSGSKNPSIKNLPWVAAGLMLPCYLMVRNAHFGSPDALMTLGLIISLASIFHLQTVLVEVDSAVISKTESDEAKSDEAKSEWAKKKSAALKWAGLSIGLTLSIKAPAILMTLPLFAACLFANTRKNTDNLSRIGWKPTLQLFVRAIGWMALGLVLTSPWLVLDLPNAVQSILYEQNAFFTYGLMGIPVGWQFYPTFALPTGLGYLTLVMALVGVWLVWPARNQIFQSIEHLEMATSIDTKIWQRHTVLLLTLLVFYVGLGPNMRVMTRYALPLLPPLILLASATLVHLHQRLKTILFQTPFFKETLTKDAAFAQKISVSLWVIILSLALIEPVRNSLLWNQLLLKGDTRQVARDWILSNIPSETPIASGPRLGHLLLPINYGQLWLETGPNNMRPPQQVSFQEVDPRTRLTNSYDINMLKQLNIRYVVLYGGQLLFSSPPWEMERFLKAGEPVFHISPYKPKIENLVSRPSAAVYDPMDAVFIPYSGLEDMAWTGPEIFIFDVTQLKQPEEVKQ